MNEEHDADYYSEKGMEYYSESNKIAALAFLGRASELGASSLRHDVCLAEFYEETADYERALTVWNRIIANLEQNPIIPDEGIPLQFYNYRACIFICLEKYDEAIADYTHAIEIDGTDASYFNGRAQAYYAKENYMAALLDMCKALYYDDTNAWYWDRRASIFSTLENKDAAAHDVFRSYLTRCKETASDDNDEDEESNPQLKDFISTNKLFDIDRNPEGSIVLRINESVHGPILPEIFYDGGNNVLFRRCFDEFIFLENISPDIRDALYQADSILANEVLDLSDDLLLENRFSPRREYTVKIRKYPANGSLDSIDSVTENGYFFFAYLASRVRANPDKPVNEIIGIEDYANLAAVLAREEDYESLQRFHDSVLAGGEGGAAFANLALNKTVSAAFISWQPTPLFYITTKKVWAGMRDGVKMLRFLAALGADPNMPSAEGDTPLYNQCLRVLQPEILKTLLEIGADPNQDCYMEEGKFRTFMATLFPDGYDEETDIFIPITKDQLKRIKLFIDYGADVTYTYDSGENALSLVLAYAKDEIREELVNLFVSKGADVKAAIKGLKKGAANGLVPYQKALADLPNIAALKPNPPACLDGCEGLAKDDLSEA